MYVYEAASLLKNVICPFCKKSTRFDMGSPFAVFNALDLNDKCDTKDCMEFFNALNTQFKYYETNQINEFELQTWLEHFKDINI